VNPYLVGAARLKHAAHVTGLGFGSTGWHGLQHFKVGYCMPTPF